LNKPLALIQVSGVLFILCERKVERRRGREEKAREGKRREEQGCCEWKAEEVRSQ
jgi:hypothetical protein